jgi:hypothetical protein
MSWKLVPGKKKPEAVPKPAVEKPTASKKPVYGKSGNPHDQFIADLVKGLQDGSIILRSVDARRVSTHPHTELMIEFLDMGAPPGVLPSAITSTGHRPPKAASIMPGQQGMTGPTAPQVHHLGHSAVSAVMHSMSSAATAIASGGMVGKVAALPGAKTYGLKLSKSVEPIVGYRDFKMIQGLYGLALQSRNGAIWPPRKKMMAMCNGDPFAPHDVPDPSCQCGIYAYAKPDASALQHDNSSLWGEIAMWGEVLVCETGYRAEFAYPTALFMRKPAMPGNRTTRVLEAIRKELEDTYGVPVFILAERASKSATQLMEEELDKLLATKKENA